MEQNKFFEKEPEREISEKIEIAMDGKKIADIGMIDFEDILGDKGTCKLVLRYGKKEMELFIEDTHGRKIVAYDGIANVRKDGSREDETTKLYEKVKTILQEAANQINMPIYYSLNAHFTLPDGKSNPMIKWADSEKRGKAVFNWTSRRIDENNKCAYFQKVFYPNN
jgi:hypothetical protein